MWMHVKPCAGGDDVVINDSQTAEVHIAGIVIASEGKGVITVKPAGIGAAAPVCRV